MSAWHVSSAGLVVSAFMAFGLLSKLPEQGVPCIMLCMWRAVGAAVSNQEDLGMSTHLGGTILRGGSRTDT